MADDDSHDNHPYSTAVACNINNCFGNRCYNSRSRQVFKYHFIFLFFLLLLSHRLDSLIYFAPHVILATPIRIDGLQVTPRYQILVVLDLQFYSFALSCFIGKLWWIGHLCPFSSLGTVSIVQCSTWLYWAFLFTHFLSTLLRVLITLLVFAPSIMRTTVGSVFTRTASDFTGCLL
jgi:hypothetical protein